MKQNKASNQEPQESQAVKDAKRLIEQLAKTDRAELEKVRELLEKELETRK